MINIPRSMIDPFYRYQRQQLDIKYLPKCGGETHIKNLSIIAKEIYTPIKILIRMLKKRLNVGINEKKDIVILRGQHTKDDLENHIEYIIENYILCKQCKNPEYKIEHNKKICLACGYC